MGKLIGIIRSLPENLCIFLQQAGRLKQLDHFQKLSSFSLTGRLSGTIISFLEIYGFFIDKIGCFSNV